VITVAVRWYLRYGLSYRDNEELLGQRGVTVDHVSVYRWVQRFTAVFIEAARPCRHAPGDRWFVDETVTGGQATGATRWALEAGYRHLDTATVYGNEAEVGAGLAGSGVPRPEVFITTKCPPGNAGRELATLERSLELLGTDHVDLWLIHWTPEKGVGVGLWQGFIDARSSGLARAIGVSNYSLAEIDELVSATGVTPAVNQIEWSPLLFDRVQLEGHRERGILLEGYSALRGGTLEHPVITAIADRLGARLPS
jgi:diketogulonate reductase-like aldo/keto reductase